MPRSSSEPRSVEPRADLLACRAMLRSGSKSFFAASLLLPQTVRDPACALYAFCRYADDAIDCEGGGETAVAMLRGQLDRIYAGHPLPRAIDRELAGVVRRFQIPRDLLDALIEGFEWDVQGRRYEDLAALEAYAARVAGTVGAMMAILMGVTDPVVIARACDLGVAMQLTNIARDIGEDARAGRLYLPLSWLRAVGLDPDRWLADPRFSPALAGVVKRLLSTAESLYSRVDAGVAGLPQTCRPGINAARVLYCQIGREIERHGFDSISRRAVVPLRRKLYLLIGASLVQLRPARSTFVPALPGVGFLVAAATASGTAAGERHFAALEEEEGVPWWRFGTRLIRLIELFDRLGRVERSAQLRRLPTRS